MLREVLDQVLERPVRHLGLVGPGRVAEDAAQPLGVGGFDGLEGVEQRPADIPRGGAHILPVRALGNLEAVVGGGGRVAGVARVLEGLLVVLVPHVAQALEEEQREDVLLVVARVDQAAQQRGRTPEVRLEFSLGQMRAHLSHPPSVSTVRRWSSAARASARAVLNASTASGSGGMSSPMGGST